MNLRWLQKNLPWQGQYTDTFERGPKHNHFAHNVLHLAKAVGKLAAAVEPLDHRNGTVTGHVSTALADVVICALRLANVCPERAIDLEAAVIERLKEKNDLKPTWPPSENLQMISNLHEVFWKRYQRSCANESGEKTRIWSEALELLRQTALDGNSDNPS